MRNVPVSTAVFAKIWSLRQEGEESEDQILRRVLNVPTTQGKDSKQAGGSLEATDGFHDPRSGVHFPDGFEIFRVYKGTEYRARVARGRWFLVNDNKLYPSLHKLSRAVVHGHENSWTNWKFEESPGKYALIDKLRDPAKIAHRSPLPVLEELEI